MSMKRARHQENHFLERIGWLRAAVLGANDGLISTSSLVMGVAAAGSSRAAVLIAAIAALVAGAGSMAAGEYVSVSSQADTERADIARERRELAEAPEAELRELTAIYVSRGLERPLAEQVAAQMMQKDALAAHLRDELGLSEITRARPLLAAVASAASFSAGALLPIAVILLAPLPLMGSATFAASLIALAGLGGVGARLGGANIWRAALRVVVWGALAMGLTALIGQVVGAGLGP